MVMMNFHHARPMATDKVDVQTFVKRLDQLKPYRKMILHLFVMEAGLMVPSLPQRIIEKGMRFWRGDVGVQQYRSVLYSRHPETFLQQYLNFLNHMEKGKDSYSDKSVGGFNQAELDEIYDFVQLLEEGKFDVQA